MKKDERRKVMKEDERRTEDEKQSTK